MRNEHSQHDVENVSAERRNFFKKTAALSATAIAGAGMLGATNAMAEDDPVIMNTPDWGHKIGYPVTKNRYGMPSPYEHNVTRRNAQLLSSGNWQASIAMCPIQDLSGIMTPNGLFFSRCHGGIPTINPNEWRLMIHGLVEKPLVLTLDRKSVV